MAKRIYKYELAPGVCTIDLPKGGTVLTAAGQHGGVFIWVMFSDTEEAEPRVFGVFATGEGISPSRELKFVQTVFLGEFVFHVFECLN